MKVVIFAGGLGTRLSEETSSKPKPLVEIGNMPILWHIMKIYSSYGLNDFIICGGYKSSMIKDFFINYSRHVSDIQVNLVNDSIEISDAKKIEPWSIIIADTGLDSLTAKRLKLIECYIDSDDFCLTYGDGLANVDINELIDFHKCHGKLATVTAVKPKPRFGALKVSESNQVISFLEKTMDSENLINGGFFVLKRDIFARLPDRNVAWEQEPLRLLASEGELMAYLHHGFWQSMDTLSEKIELNNLWKGDCPPWKTW